MRSFVRDGARRLPPVPVSPGLAGVAWSPCREVVVFIIANVISRPALGTGMLNFPAHRDDPAMAGGAACRLPLPRPLTFR